MQLQKRFVPMLLGAALLVATGVGCESDEGEVPESAEARLEQQTGTLPADASFVYTISDLEGFRSNAQKAKKTVGRLFPVDRLIERAKQSPAGSKFFSEDGIEVFNEKFWKESGIAPNSAFTLGMVDYNTVMLTYVDDQKKFEKDLLADLDTDNKPTSKSIGDKQVKTIETDKGTVLWNYRGKLATVLFPDGNQAAPSDAETPKTSKTFERIVGTKKKDSLFSTDGFGKFRDAAGDRNALAYAQLTPHIKRGMLQGNSGEMGKTYAENVEKSLDGFGFLLETKENRIQPRMWVGLTDKGKKHFDELFSSPVTAKWAQYATTDTLIGLRSAGNWKNIWESFTSTMSKGERQTMKENFQMAAGQTGIDVEKDVIGNLNGQAGLLMYGLGGQASPRMLSQPSKILQNLEAMYLMKFGDAEVLDKLTDKASEMETDNVTVRPVKIDGEETGIRAVDLTIPEGGMIEMMLQRSQQAGSMAGSEAPIRFYVHKDTIALATTSIEESTIQQMVTGADGGEPLTDSSDLDLGGKFAEQEQLTGLYLNMVRLRNILGNQIPPIPAIQKPINTLQEALLATKEADQGAWLNLTIDLMPDQGNQGGSGK